MTIEEFNALTRNLQTQEVLVTGHFLAARWEKDLAVSLYFMPNGFFVEVYDDMRAKRTVRLRPLTGSPPLDAYVPNIVLPLDL